MEKLWEEKQMDGYRLIRNEEGKDLGVSDGSKVKILTVDGHAFKDFLGTGELVPYEDWRLSARERAEDLAARLPVEDIAGLMLYSAHQIIPAQSGPGPFTATYGGKSLEESGGRTLGADRSAEKVPDRRQGSSCADYGTKGYGNCSAVE